MPIRLLLTLGLTLALLAAPLRAQDMDYGSVRLLRGEMLQDGSYQGALLFDLNPGWKTYWRAPGPNGLPPRLSWEGSRNVAQAVLSWPTPQVLDRDSAASVGYTGTAVLPLRLIPERPGPMTLSLQVDFGVCLDICIPATETLLARLDARDGPDSEAIAAALARVPHPGAGVQAVDCTLTPNDQGFAIEARIALDRPMSAPFAVIEYPDRNMSAEVASLRSDGRQIALSARLRNWGGGPAFVARDDLTLTLIGPDRAVEIRGCTAG
jgi:DsbC/DsbD-like thiol-disulfide interchange protein